MPVQSTMVIAVMGVTGSGKSTFVRLASGDDNVVVGHSLEACTQETAASQFSANGYNIILVDTPGFNDTYKSDTEVLWELARWLEVSYKQDTKLTGLIYLHRITDVRMDGGGMRNLRMFRKLCGEKPMENVIIASTFWGGVDDEKAISHERELKEKPDFWGDMIRHGAQVARFAGDRESALDILMRFSCKATVTLDIQRELVDEKKLLVETAAGNAIDQELHELEKNYRGQLQDIKTEAAAALAAKDAQYENALKMEREEMERKLDRLHADQELLRQERREDIRQLVMDNQLQFSLWKKEYEKRLETQRLETEKRREEDHASLRGQLRDIQTKNEAFTADLLKQIKQIQSENDELRSSTGKCQKSESKFGEKLVNLVAAGTFAYTTFDPVAIPVVLGALVEFVGELDNMSS